MHDDPRIDTSPRPETAQTQGFQPEAIHREASHHEAIQFETIPTQLSDPFAEPVGSGGRARALFGLGCLLVLGVGAYALMTVDRGFELTQALDTSGSAELAVRSIVLEEPVEEQLALETPQVAAPEASAPVEVAAAVQETPVASAPQVKEAEELAAPVVKTTLRAHFAYDSAKLSVPTRRALDAWARRMEQDRGLKLRIEGHADERGSTRYNQRLGMKRAQAAKSYLVDKGIAPERIKTQSFGKSRPIAKGKSERAYSQNRRVEMKPVPALGLAKR